MVYQTDLDPNAQGGGIRYVQDLTNYLLNNGWRITFLGAGSFAGKPHSNLTFHKISSLQSSWVTFFWGLWFFLWSQPTRPDTIIHVHRAYFAFPFIIISPRSHLVCTLHGDTLLVLAGKSRILRFLVEPFFRLLELFCLANIDQIISVDELTANKFLNRYPFSWLKDKINIIPTAVDVLVFFEGDKSKAREYLGLNLEDEIVLFVGRLAEIKNIPFLLRVFAKIEQQRPKAHLLLVGDGEEKGSLIDYAKKLGINQASFMGVVAHKDIPKLMQAADVLALCSHSEASPIVVKEAVACGLPVVTTAVGDVSQVIKNRKLGTVVSNDEVAFYDALWDWLEGYAVQNRNLKSKKERTWQNFKIDGIYGKIIEIYKKIY